MSSAHPAKPYRSSTVCKNSPRAIPALGEKVWLLVPAIRPEAATASICSLAQA